MTLMAESKVEPSCAQFHGARQSLSMQNQQRPTPLFNANFNLNGRNSKGEAGAKSLYSRFLGSETAAKEGAGIGGEPLQLIRMQKFLGKARAVPGIYGGDPVNFHNIYACADYHSLGSVIIVFSEYAVWHSCHANTCRQAQRKMSPLSMA